MFGVLLFAQQCWWVILCSCLFIFFVCFVFIVSPLFLFVVFCGVFGGFVRALLLYVYVCSAMDRVFLGCIYILCHGLCSSAIPFASLVSDPVTVGSNKTFDFEHWVSVLFFLFYSRFCFSFLVLVPGVGFHSVHFLFVLFVLCRIFKFLCLFLFWFGVLLCFGVLPWFGLCFVSFVLVVLLLVFHVLLNLCVFYSVVMVLKLF